MHDILVWDCFLLALGATLEHLNMCIAITLHTFAQTLRPGRAPAETTHRASVQHACRECLNAPLLVLIPAHLQNPDEGNHANDAKAQDAQLLPQLVHLRLQRRAPALHILHVLESLAEFRFHAYQPSPGVSASAHGNSIRQDAYLILQYGTADAAT